MFQDSNDFECVFNKLWGHCVCIDEYGLQIVAFMEETWKPCKQMGPQMGCLLFAFVTVRAKGLDWAHLGSEQESVGWEGKWKGIIWKDVKVREQILDISGDNVKTLQCSERSGDDIRWLRGFVGAHGSGGRLLWGMVVETQPGVSRTLV